MQSNKILQNEVNPDQLPAHSFAKLCHVLYGIMHNRSKAKKIDLYARYLQSLCGMNPPTGQNLHAPESKEHGGGKSKHISSFNSPFGAIKPDSGNCRSAFDGSRSDFDGCRSDSGSNRSAFDGSRSDFDGNSMPDSGNSRSDSGPESDISLQLAVQFTADGAFPSASGKRASAGHRTVALAASGFCGIDYDKVFKPCRLATGSASEAIEKLMDNLPQASSRRNPAWMSLEQVSAAFSRLASAAGREQKQRILGEIWEKMTSLEIRFMIRMLSQGSLRIGFELQSILPAIAQAFHSDPDLVRRVHMLTGNIGVTSVMARNKKLNTAQFRIFQPVAFMLASPVEVRNVDGVKQLVSDPSGYVAEEKFDGMRAQVHISRGKILLFSRDSNDITGSFTDVADDIKKGMTTVLEQSSNRLDQHADSSDQSLNRLDRHADNSDQSSIHLDQHADDPGQLPKHLEQYSGDPGQPSVSVRHARCAQEHPGDGRNELSDASNDASSAPLNHRDQVTPEIVFDGELCVFQNGTIQPFQRLQKRMGVKKPAIKLMKEHPVRFIACDLLFCDGNPVIDLPLHKRRELLEYWCSRLGIRYSRQYKIASHQDIEALFQQALSHGNEGLMLKRHDSVYEFGQRNRSWLKVKQPGGSLDTIIMYAHAGSGRRGGTWSDFTLGIRVDQDPRYEEQFIPIGKVYGGCTNDELKKLNKSIRELTVDRFGPTLSLRPGIVVEVEFDGIQENGRTKAGYTLRLPRFRSIRWDLSPSDTDTLRDVENMHQLSITKAGSPVTARHPVIFPD